MLKPRMRGWLHFWSFTVSIAAGATMIAVSAALVGAVAALAVAVYAVTTLGLFGVSALYHRRTWRTARSRAVMRRLDHSMIFLFIAGTYTPVAVLAMDPATARTVLTVVWVGALAGVVLKTVWPHAPAWIGVPVYIALGWVAIFVLPAILEGGGPAPLVLILAGGLFYTVGAIFYATRRPNPWPATFGFHEFFHAATVVAAICHHVAIWLLLF
ncbi:MAG TPA: hemolysin III family protein [Pseudonocardia sp.]|jgi:hemolysin III|uniref:PAQR family membrane homeostasis protein TrhA n=1 Tax=Pseudonocardia sp. TaxID=60912 RepID=UPI002B4AC7D0|nr:hemolysin III family protein [Pseudonocardia sp.]HLU58296.1 hemolysin III family protein [Pseudonocardia sp.]